MEQLIYLLLALSFCIHQPMSFQKNEFHFKGLDSAELLMESDVRIIQFLFLKSHKSL